MNEEETSKMHQKVPSLPTSSYDGINTGKHKQDYRAATQCTKLMKGKNDITPFNTLY
jgi:hypothetical protein